MKLRLLWVDDEAGFGSRQKKENWPPVMPDLLHDNAIPKADGSFSVSGGQPASFIEIRFAPSFSAGLRLTQSHTFDLAILDMRLKSEGTESEFINNYLIDKGLQVHVSAPMENQMTLAFWLWRELIDRSNKVLTFFYTSYGDSGEAFVYQPFMFPDPKREMTPAIYAKNDEALSQRIERFLDTRALTTLAANPPGLLAKLTTELRLVERGKDLIDLLNRDSLIDLESDQRTSLADLFPALALAACTDKGGGINRHKQKTLYLLERAGARHQQCAVLARLTSPRNLDWTNRPTYGIHLVEDLTWGKRIKAWPVGVGYSPLEMLSHGRTQEMTTEEDWNGWNGCKDLAQTQIESLKGYLRDKDALETVREWGNFCHKLKFPFVDYATPQEIVIFKSAFRWTPHEVLESIINRRSNMWRLVATSDHEIFGYRSSIQDGLQWFLSDLEDNSAVNDGIAGSAGTTRPRKCWMFIAGEPKNNRAWPHVKSEGNKLRSGLLLLTGYLIAYQFRRGEEGFEWRCFEERGEHLDLDERCELEQCVDSNLTRPQPVVGYAFVLTDYPPERESQP